MEHLNAVIFINLIPGRTETVIRWTIWHQVTALFPGTLTFIYLKKFSYYINYMTSSPNITIRRAPEIIQTSRGPVFNFLADRIWHTISPIKFGQIVNN